MNILTLDFESFYDKDYTLSKITTEEYVNDPRFQIIGVGMKLNNDKTQWISSMFKSDIAGVLKMVDWENTALLCHNMLFDGFILARYFGIVPALYLDTLCMARAIHGVDAGGSLAKLASRYQLGEKGNEIINALGKRREDFSGQQLAAYGDYCRNDCDLTFKLFTILAKNFPETELKLIDLTIRMFTDPVFRIDSVLLREKLAEVKQSKSLLLNTFINELGVKTEEGVRELLCSNPKFAEVLRSYGVEPPMKESPTTGKPTYAFAKTDEGFVALTEHENPIIQHLCAVRLGTKSTLEESRIQRFVDIATRNVCMLPIPLKYYAAHTGRWGGTDGINMQNLPSRDKNKKTLKNSILPKPGNVVVNADSSQIEARKLAWWAGQDDIVEAFRQGRDVYSEFATKVYRVPVSKATPEKRFVGKESILSLGFGVGRVKLRRSLKLKGNVDMTEDECRAIVDLYRSENDKIVALWKECDEALNQMLIGVTKPFYLGKHKVVLVDKEGIRLPNGLYIRYPNLRREDRHGKSAIVYDSRKGPVSIWGGAMVENVVQALAKIVVGEQMVWISEHYRPGLTVHDAAVLSVPVEELDDAVEYITLCMSAPPAWAPGLPVTCEVKHGPTYGDC